MPGNSPRFISTWDDEQIELSKLRSERGHRFCRWCRGECPKKRQTFCSKLCIHEWKLRSRGSYLRKYVYMRDHGACAKCGLCCDSVERELLDSIHAARMTKEWRAYDEHLHPIIEGVLAKYSLGKKDLWRTLWEVDHIIPVAAGGGRCGLEGVQTLCLPCHREKSASHRRRP
jgi:5-methylcytosine-specific restriction protein A